MSAADDFAALGRFDVILADPPWAFSGNSEAKPGRNVRRHYPTMTLPQICALPVSMLAQRDALLLMWITAPLSHRTAEVCGAWGFRPVSQVVWVKHRIGLGHWARARHELLVIATRGDFPCPVPALFPDSVIEAPAREHSRKPDVVHALVDTRLPQARKVELFARQRRPGWVAWGNDVDRFEGVA